MRLALLILLLVPLAGCLSDGPETGPEATPEAGTQFEEDRGRGNITVDEVALPSEPPAPGERTLMEAPLWRLGEWWKYRITENFQGNTYEVLRVVAGTERGDYLVGFPIDGFSNDVMVLHTPGYGDIYRNLSYSAHDVPFVPLKFPLVEGQTWDTQWENPGSTMSVTVDSVEDGQAHMTVQATSQSGFSGEFVYDAEIGEITKLTLNGYGTYEIVDHGYAFQGDVRVPHAHDLVFFHGRLGGGVDISQPLVPPTLAPPLETIPIPEGYDRLSFLLGAQDIAAAQAGQDASAVYSIKATAPQGDIYELTLTPADGSDIKFEFFGHDEPAGDWELEFLAPGPGYAFIEGIGYHSIDIRLPEGCVIESKNAQHHGSLCKTT